MSSLRDKFKATSVKNLRKAAEADEKMLGISSNEYLQLEDNKTLKIRIFPAHPDVESFYISRKSYWLPIIKNDGDRGRTVVNDSTVHGGTRMDLVDEYIKFAKKLYGSDKEKMDALTGRDGLFPVYSWLCYADKIQPDTELKAKLWEFKKSVRDALNRLTFTEDEDEAIETDPFTDIDEGLPVNVTYRKNPNKKKGENFYDVAFAKKPVARPLTDAELEYFSDLKPLNEVLGRYGVSDFERALSGLKIWDEDNEFELFDNDDWLAKVEEIRAQYDEGDAKPAKSKKSRVDDDEDEEEEKPAKKSVKKQPAKVEEEDDEDEDDEDTEEPAEEDSEDEFDELDRTELKKYIKANGLDIVVKKSMTDDDLRDAIREAVKDSDDDDDEDSEDDEDEEEEKPAKKSKDEDEDDDDEDEEVVNKVSLSDIRKKLAGK